MSRESMQTLSDQAVRGKMPLFDGTIASTGLSKERMMSGFMSKQKVQYNGAYFAYEPREDDCAGFTPPWSSSKTSPLDDRSPVSHLSEMVAQNHMKYRKDSISAEEGQSHSSVCHTPIKKGFVPYTKSPEINNPAIASSVVLRKPQAGGESSSSPSENPIYIAIPKPVYGLNPCCNDVGCTIGQRYNLGQVSPRIPNTVYEHDWMQSNGHYTEKPSIQRKDTLLQHKDFQFECSAEQLKRMTVEAYSPNRARTLPSVIEPSASSYPCTPTRALFGCFRDHSGQALQTPPGAYPSLYAPRPTYEHMTSEVYQECSPMSKYGHLAQHPVFYYSQANAEVENRRQRKDSGSKPGEGAPFLHKHTISNPREHYIVSQPHHPEIPMSCTEMLPNHSLLRGFEYPCYTIPRFHLNASQIRAPPKRQQSLSAFHPAHINVPPSSQHAEHSIAKDKPNTSLYVDQLHNSSSFLLMEQKSPSRRANQAAVSPSSLQASRLFQPFAINAPLIPPGVIVERVLDHSSYEAQVKQPKSLPVSPAAWLHQSPGHSSDLIHTAVPNHANVRKIIFSPTVKTGNKHNGLVSDAGTADYKKCLKRSASRSSPPMKMKVEDKHLYEMECSNKRQKMEMGNLKGGNETDSPPMPVIDNVFSLAAYQPQLQESGGRVPLKPAQTSEQHEDKLKQKTKDSRLKQNDQQLVCQDYREISSSPAEDSDVEVFKPKIVKVEKLDSFNEDCGKESQNNHNRVTIKNEPEEPRASDCKSTLLKEKSDKRELKLLLKGENTIPDESRPADSTAQVNPSSQEDALQQQAVDLQPKSSPLQPPASKVNFRSIPPHCLKLSTYNIIIPDGKHCRTVPPPQDKLHPQLHPQLLAVAASKKEFHPPVRKHFHELHQSLCSMVSKSVSASSEQELRNWLTQLEITEPRSQSDKVQKVSCLLGAKSREAWINEEVKSALRDVLERLREYTAQRTCPFPHVVRTGAVFLPMLVVKELLFPMVHSGFIDKILQEYKVELRPTTLSEEKILIQLHKRACSSRLRRLMSLKHLPDIYSEVVNLLYYTCVCKHLGLNVEPSFKEQHRSHEASNSSTPADTAASPASPSDSPSDSAHHQTYMEDQETPPNKNITKGGKSSSAHTLLDKNAFDEEETGDAGETVGKDLLTNRNEDAPECETKITEHEAAEQGCAVTLLSAASESSWTCPLTLDELSPSDTETESSSIELSGVQSSAHQLQFNHCSGMILKLRKMLSGSLNRRKACYQAVSASGTLGEPLSVQTGDSNGVSSKKSLHRTPKAARRWKSKGSFSYALRPLSSPSKTKRTSLLKIKYCPYLSTCHSAEHRRRWVLRSAVQRARRAMRLSYPDLVGKRIRHLYEEDDKSEVWYRGEVLRVHEAHANPLKTIFEVKYDSEPEWKYYLELLIDYKKGWLKIED